MDLLKEMKRKVFNVLDHKVKVHCRVLEDNSGATEMVVVHKWRPRTKHLTTKLHHFRSYVNSGEISVHKIDTQPHLIDSILQDLSLKEVESKCKDTPMKSSTILNKSKNSQEFYRSFNYQSFIGKMNYLEKGSQSELAYAIHQCARYSTDPCKEHGDDVR